MTSAILAARMRKLAPWTLILASAALAIAAYLQALHYLFLSDDTAYITENTKLAGLRFNELWRLFIEPYNRYSEFLPLRELSYWFDITLFGLNSAAFRMHNIILYLLCLPLIYGTTLGLWRYFRPADAMGAPWAGAAVTALFALHPALVESVVWISGRKYVLPNLYAMIALWLAVSARREQGLSVPHAAAALLAFVAMMLAKASYVAVAPIIALLWLMFWSDIPAPGRRRAQLLWPLAILVLALCLVLIFIASNQDNASAYLGIEMVTRTFAVLGWLVRLAITPENRHFFYPVLDDPYLPVMVVLGLAVLLAAAVVSVAVILRKRLSLEGFALATFLLLCLPYMQLVPYAPPFSIVSDRFLTLAAWPAVLLIVALAWRLKPVLRTALLLVIALLWSWQTVQRPRDWRSLEALIDADVRAYPGYYIPAQHKIIDVQLKRRLHREALETAQSITNRDARNIMIELVKADEAVKLVTPTTGNLQEAMTILWKLELDIKLPVQAKWNPASSNFWGRIGLTLINEWEYLAKQFPDVAPVHYNAGLWLLKVHKYKEAVVHWRAATDSQGLPESARGTAFKNLGLALIGAGDVAAAEAPLRAALAQSPPDFRAYCALSEVYKRSGRLEEAARAGADCRNRAPNEEAVQ
jgi:tetratricopeptide (TPR) repeat protein